MPSAANQNVYTGADGTILLAPAGDGPEGGAASAVIEGNDLIQVGRVTGVTVQVSSAIRPFHEIGQRYALDDCVAAHQALESGRTIGSSIFLL